MSLKLDETSRRCKPNNRKINNSRSWICKRPNHRLIGLTRLLRFRTIGRRLLRRLRGTGRSRRRHRCSRSRILSRRIVRVGTTIIRASKSWSARMPKWLHHNLKSSLGQPAETLRSTTHWDRECNMKHMVGIPWKERVRSIIGRLVPWLPKILQLRTFKHLLNTLIDNTRKSRWVWWHWVMDLQVTRKTCGHSNSRIRGLPT